MTNQAEPNWLVYRQVISLFKLCAEEARENVIVRNLWRGSGIVVITLGADHDLTDNLKRLGVACKSQRTKH